MGARPVPQRVLFFHSFCRVFSRYSGNTEVSSLPSKISRGASRKARRPECCSILSPLPRDPAEPGCSPLLPWYAVSDTAILCSRVSAIIYKIRVSVTKFQRKGVICKGKGVAESADRLTHALKGRCQGPILFKMLNFNISASS